MANRISRKKMTGGSVRTIARFPWKLFAVLLLIAILAIPTFLYLARVGGKVLPSITQFFYNLSDATPTAVAIAHPPYAAVLPQVGSIHYTVKESDSCDSILASQMNMQAAGVVFSDANAGTVQALNAVVGQDCHALQPGLVLSLPPQYPLVALGGVVQKIESTTTQQAVPTPLIRVPDQPSPGPDCSNSCRLTVQINPHTRVYLTVSTTLTIHVGSWVWAQAQLPPKTVAGFNTYPYVDPQTSFNGMTLPVCDFQVDNLHDDNSASCSSLTPNTIGTDQGSWLLGVVGPSALDHWHYPLHFPAGTQVMIWLSRDHGSLVFRTGNPIYRYDDASHMYVKS